MRFALRRRIARTAPSRTFCTVLLTEWDLTDREAADIMGWSPERVAQIRKVDVDRLRVVVALGERIAAKQADAKNKMA